MAEVFRNAIEFYVLVHAGSIAKGKKRTSWTPPVCRATGLKADPFANENWREEEYEDRLVERVWA